MRKIDVRRKGAIGVIIINGLQGGGETIDRIQTGLKLEASAPNGVAFLCETIDRIQTGLKRNFRYSMRQSGLRETIDRIQTGLKRKKSVVTSPCSFWRDY